MFRGGGRLTDMMMIAAHDGDLVWGLGATDAEARADAARWIDEQATPIEVSCDEITDAEADVVRAGTPTWPITVPTN